MLIHFHCFVSMVVLNTSLHFMMPTGKNFSRVYIGRISFTFLMAICRFIWSTFFPKLSISKVLKVSNLVAVKWFLVDVLICIALRSQACLFTICFLLLKCLFKFLPMLLLGCLFVIDKQESSFYIPYANLLPVICVQLPYPRLWLDSSLSSRWSLMNRSSSQ